MEVLVIRKPIKNVHLSVLPPNGKIRVTSPLNMKDDAIRVLVSTRIPWIRKQQKKFSGQERQTPRGYISGETHYFFGKPYRLEVIFLNEPPKITIKGNTKILLQVRPETTLTKREDVMSEWYREELQKVLTGLFDKWEKKIGVKVKFWSIKRMKTRWGSCNQKEGRILINLELAKKPLNCIEYVVVHELLHLLERKHDDKFLKLMTKFLPKWQSLKEDLNKMILSYEKWSH